MHPRTSSGKVSVGAKPYTQCLVATPSKINHSSVLYMVEWFGLSWVPMASKGQTGYNTRNMTLASLEWVLQEPQQVDVGADNERNQRSGRTDVLFLSIDREVPLGLRKVTKLPTYH